MDRLEQRVSRLEELPQQLDAMKLQLLQLHQDVGDVKTDVRTLTRVVETLHTATNERMEELNAETRRHMRVLHEELIDRLKRLGES